MKIFGFQITRTKAVVEAMGIGDSGGAFGGGGWFGAIRESFAGAFQSAIEVDAPKNILAFSAVFACVTLIASDIAKLGVDLMVEDDNDISTPIEGNSPYLAVLKKPNRYQTWYKFMEQWIVSKLLYGNSYALKQRDNRGIVTNLYILDAQRVTPLVATNGDVYYRLSADHLAGLADSITVPATEIIHDTMVSLWHPLVGISPIYACGMSATMGNKIQANSTRFFANASRPSGALSAPGPISDETALRLKSAWEENYGGSNIGRLAVLGDGLAYQAMTIPAVESQMLEQLKWTAEDVARAFHVPMWKIGGVEPVRTSVESLNQTYYSDCLQALIESAEALLNEGMELPSKYEIEFCLDGLLRMDTVAQYKALGDGVNAALLKPNEARKKLNLPPLDGGDTIYMQQQNYSLAALAKRDAQADPFGTKQPPATTPALPAPAPAANDAQIAAEAAKAFLNRIQKGLECIN